MAKVQCYHFFTRIKSELKKSACKKTTVIGILTDVTQDITMLNFRIDCYERYLLCLRLLKKFLRFCQEYRSYQNCIRFRMNGIAHLHDELLFVEQVKIKVFDYNAIMFNE